MFWDSSAEGAARISIRERPDELWQTAGMRYDGTSPARRVEAQVHRESAGGPLARQLPRGLVDIRGKRVLFVNDCLPVVLAMQKGSNSRVLQADAEYMARAGLEAGALLLFLHVPGTRMIEEGVESAGRGGARRIIGPACSPSTREAIRALCAQHGWRITIDLFAANCNRLVERFASWTDEPDSEVVDAFTIRSWNQTKCKCGWSHRETAFVFPPIGLERTIVRRERSDGGKGDSSFQQHTRQDTGWRCRTTQLP
jgi:hypothetical protein